MSDSGKKKKSKKGKKNSTQPAKVLKEALAGAKGTDESAAGESGAPPKDPQEGATSTDLQGGATPTKDNDPQDTTTPTNGKDPQGGRISTLHGYESVLFTSPADPETMATELGGYEEIPDGRESKKKSVGKGLASSGTYEVPSLDQVGGATGGNTGGHALSSGYMAIQSISREKIEPEYECPENHKRKTSVRVKQFFMRTIASSSEETPAETDAGPHPHHYHSNRWSIILICVCLLVAAMSLLLSFVAIGVSASGKSCDCTAAGITQPRPSMMNCSITVATSCSFMSGVNQSESCETRIISSVSEGSTVLSLGCSVNATPPRSDVNFLSTLHSDQGGYFCRCYRDGDDENLAIEQDVSCSVISTQCR